MNFFSVRPLRIFGIDTRGGVYPTLADALREVPLSAVPGLGHHRAAAGLFP